MCNSLVLPPELKFDLQNPELFTQLTLDASLYVNDPYSLEALDRYSKEYIQQIHRKRIARLVVNIQSDIELML